MILRLVILGVSVLSANPAYACLLSIDTPPREDLSALNALAMHIATENDIKSQIDASVWGVFLDQPSIGLIENGYSRFKVGGISKGKPDKIIRLVSLQRDVKLGTQIHYLNLRKIDQSRWTDVGVTQQELNWGPEICEISPNTSKCKLQEIEQDKIKDTCRIFIREVYYGCLSSSALPRMCAQYEDTAFEE